MKKGEFFLKRIVNIDLFALYAITIQKLKILCKDIINFKYKSTLNKNILKNCKSCSKYWKIKNKLLQNYLH